MIEYLLVIPVVALLVVGAIWRPDWCLIVMFALLPLVDVLPDIPYATSIVSVLGGVAFLGALLHHVVRGKSLLHQPKSWVVLGIGFLFVLWITLSHPYTISEGGERNWLFTFIQLLVLLWLVGMLLQKPEQQQLLMVLFAIACIVSAAVAISESSLAATRASSVRSAGLFDGLNLAARYFVIAFVFLVYLLANNKKRVIRWFLLLGMGLMLVAVAYTLSRSGIALMVIAIALIIFRVLHAGGKRTLLYLSIVLLLGLFLVPETFWQALVSSITGREYVSLRARTNSIQSNVRFDLWYAGFRMWLDHPFAGVGIGQFTKNLFAYLPAYSVIDKELGAHSMYVQMLAETGLIGFGLFMTLLWKTGKRLYVAGKPKGKELITIEYVWFVTFLVMALGGIFKNDHYDKMLWLFIGLSIVTAMRERLKTKSKASLVQVRWLQAQGFQ